MPYAGVMKQAPQIYDYLSRDEIAAFSEKSDLRAVVTLGMQIALFALAFALAILWPNPLTIVLAVLLLGGRIQAWGVLAHDCAHGAFFRTPWLNQFVGRWVVGAAGHVPLEAYRRYHLEHHRHAGTPDDPDKWMVKNYPISRASLKRKFARDLTGRTGFRDLLREVKGFDLAANGPTLLFHLVLAGTLTALGAAWAYLLYWAARLFVYPAIHRLRQISEHGVVPDRDVLDARLNTGTTIPHWWERLLVSPCNVNYHLEHHIFAAVPPYRLPALHRTLAERGYYEGHDCITRGFANVLRKATKAGPAPVAA